MFRKISAQYIFPVSGPPLKYGIVICDASGKITELVDTGGKLSEEANLEFYNGIITPGFVNAHCHLELSHLKGRIPRNETLSGFVKNIGMLRNEGGREEAIQSAEKLMLANGIVACGDISNSDASFPVKEKSSLYFHTFIELFGIQNANAQNVRDKGIALEKILHDTFRLTGNISPHAPYSVSSELWRHFVRESAHMPIWSIHNQENADEDLLFEKNQGAMALFLERIDPDYKASLPAGKSSLQAMMPFYEKASRLLLIHNTYTQKQDFPLLKRLGKRLFLVLCPNSNLYIEGKLPSQELLENSSFSFAIGTDSLASNDNLSVLEEIKTLQQYFPMLRLETLIRWATWNGAMALNCEHEFGSLEVNKRPGINLISGVDLHSLTLTNQAIVKRLI